MKKSLLLLSLLTLFSCQEQRERTLPTSFQKEEVLPPLEGRERPKVTLVPSLLDSG